MHPGESNNEAGEPRPNGVPDDALEDFLRELPDSAHDAGPGTPEADCFLPPKTNCVVVCLHCREQYDSYRIVWREFQRPDAAPQGFWCCPTSGCDGKGFLFDIHPVDANWEDDEDRGMTGGWFDDDGNPCSPLDLDGDDGPTDEGEHGNE